MSKILFVFFLLYSLSSYAIPHEGQKIMISAATPQAVQSGVDVYKKTENIVDAAVAVALSLAVTSPYNSAFGGGGFALIKYNGKVHVLDFRETAPLKTSPNYYKTKKESASRDGGAAVGIPGMPMGLWQMHKKFGSAPWASLFDDALKLSNDGFQVSAELGERIELSQNRFNDAAKESWFIDGKPAKAGDTIKQPRLHKFLNLYKDNGAKAFYEKDVAQDIISTANKFDGDLSKEDFKKYSVRWLKPLITNFEGYRIYLMPPPSSGGFVIQTALKLIDILKLQKLKPLSVDELHLFAEIMKHSFRGRYLLGDPDFYDNPLEKLSTRSYIGSLAKNIRMEKVAKLKPLKRIPFESSETTHFSLLDSKGNAVSATITLNGNFGSGLVSKKYGIALNNEMDDFTTILGKPNMYGLIQGKANKVEPGKRPLSSMSPTLVEKNGKVIMAIGAPGGPRIINGTLQALYRVLVNGYDMDLAIQTPRIHHQFLPDTLFLDPKRFSPDIIKALQQRGHKIDFSPIARVYGVYLNNKKLLEGAFDSRGYGAAAGY